ncbi:MAG: YeeE/YedE family protein [Planctomycetes bacterium]|jgi:uncharacterized membrane protein YedE/YeeE|nr:YeeE/YedE family protein [Planctomycetota bacterium]
MTTAETLPKKTTSILSGLAFGVIFGFLLQKGGVADYDVLIGSLRLTDPTVFTVILTAIVVGSIASALLRRFGLARAHTKPTHYASNVIGGLLFGVGFGLLGYCPGTGAAALGQGSWDAAYGVIGLIAGSFAYAVAFPFLKKLNGSGDRGKLTVPTALHLPAAVYLGVSSVAFLIILYFLNKDAVG